MAISNYTATTTSGTAVSANSNRSSLVITNSGANGVFINFGEAAEVNKGIYLSPNGGTFTMGRNTFSKNLVSAITATGTSNICVYER